MLTEKFIHLGIASCPAGPDMLAEMDRRAFPMAIDETKLPFWGEVNGLLRERVGCDAAVEFEFPTYRGNGGIVQPLTFAEQVCFNHPFVTRRLRCNATFQFVFRLHAKPTDKRKDDPPSEMDLHDRTKLTNRISITTEDAGKLCNSGLQFGNDVSPIDLNNCPDSEILDGGIRIM